MSSRASRWTALSAWAFSVALSVRLFAAVSALLLAPIAVGLVVTFFARFRRAHGEEHQQIKWVAYAVVLFAAAVVITTVWPSLDRSPVGNVLILAGYLAIPSAMAVPILRYRLYNIDVVINRTLVYGSLTATLALVYFGSMVTLQYIFRFLTGETSQVVVVASTLIIAALFNPLRRQVQNAVDRRFYRRKYDAAKTLEAFSARLRAETDVDALSDDLPGVLHETLQPAHASVWLPKEEKILPKRLP